LKKAAYTAIFICLLLCFTGCGANNVSGNIADIESGKETTERLFQQTEGAENIVQTETQINEPYTTDTKIAEVISDPVFGEHGKLIFPVDSGYYSGNTLGTLRLTWYSNIDPEKTVEIANYLREHAAAGETYFYDIYTDEEKAVDPAKQDTGLFFFKGNPGEKFAVCNAGGGFAYVGAMQDSFPHALELSKKGYNAFALLYRSGGQQAACEDLARAITVIFDRAQELSVDTSDYSLWGGSAGARMAAALGASGPAAYGGKKLLQPAAVVKQYTAYSAVGRNEPPTYACVGTNDGIADYRTMQERIDKIRAQGTDAEIEVFDGLSHGLEQERRQPDGWTVP